MTFRPLCKFFGLAALAALLCAPGLAQSTSTFQVFGGPVLGAPSGFVFGASAMTPIEHNISFEPSIAFGRSGSNGLFTLSGVFDYVFHPDNEAFIPYIFGGVGMSQWESATHGSLIAGLGVRFPVGNDAWIVPEIRAGSHGIARFTIGYSRSF